MEQIRNLIDWAIPQWPFLAIAAILWIAGACSAKVLFPKAPGQPKSFGRKTLSMQPLLYGLVVGVLWTDPAPGIRGYESIACFLGAGAASLVAYQIAKPWLKSRNIDLELPGLSDYPSTLPPDPAVPRELADSEIRHE